MQNSFELFPEELLANLRMRRSHSRHFLIRAINRRMLQDVDDFLPSFFAKFVDDASFQDRLKTRRPLLNPNRVQTGQILPTSILRDHFSTKAFSSEEKFSNSSSVELSRPIQVRTQHKPPPSFHQLRSDVRNHRSRMTNSTNYSFHDVSDDVTPTYPQLRRTEGDGSEAIHLVPNRPIPIQVSHTPPSDEPPDFVSPRLLLLRGEKNRRQMARVRVAQGKKPVPVRTEVCETSFPTLVGEQKLVDTSRSPANTSTLAVNQQVPVESDSEAKMSVRVLKHIGNPPLEILRSSKMRFGAIQHVAVETNDTIDLQYVEVKDQEVDNIEAMRSEQFLTGRSLASVDRNQATQLNVTTHVLHNDATTQNDVKMLDAEVMHVDKTEFSLELGPIEMDVECYPVCSDHPAGFGKSGFEIPSSKPSFEISNSPSGTFASFYRLPSCEEELEDRITEFGHVSVDGDVTSTDDVLSKRVEPSDVSQPISELVATSIGSDTERFHRSTSKCTCEEISAELPSPPGSEPTTPVVSCNADG